MNNRHFILATAGHVDHGKSSLVKALTGIDPDRLPEEKARGITIDLGFAHLELPAPADNAALGTHEVGSSRDDPAHISPAEDQSRFTSAATVVAGEGHPGE